MPHGPFQPFCSGRWGPPGASAQDLSSGRPGLSSCHGTSIRAVHTLWKRGVVSTFNSHS